MGEADQEQGILLREIARETWSAARALLLFVLIGTVAVRTGTALFDLIRIFRLPSAELSFWDWLMAWQWPGWTVICNMFGRFAVWFVLLLTLMLMALKLGNRILSLQITERYLQPGDRLREAKARGMIAFLSSPPPAPEKKEMHEKLVAQVLERKDDPNLLNAICLGKEEFGQWNWQPLFVGLNACLAEDGHVVLLTSTGCSGSDKRFEQARYCIEVLFPKVKVAQIEGLDVYRLSSMHEGLRLALRHLHKNGVKDHDIIIDITSGTAVCSLAGLIRAMERDRRALYSGMKDQGNSAPKPLITRLKVTFFDSMKPS